jgi:hypothetical protein
LRMQSDHALFIKSHERVVHVVEWGPQPFGEFGGRWSALVVDERSVDLDADVVVGQGYQPSSRRRASEMPK